MTLRVVKVDVARDHRADEETGVSVPAAVAPGREHQVLHVENGVWGATEQKTGLRNCCYSSSCVSALRRGRSCPCVTESGSANAYRPRKLMCS
jgi:hypothetical protein